LKHTKHLLLLILLTIISVSCSEFKLIQKYELDSPTIEIKGDKAFVNGVLGVLFYDLFKETLEQHPEIKTVVLIDIPGSLNDEWNVKSCLLLYEKGLNTELLSTSEVDSGGVDLFVSGRKLTIAEGAKIGVHSWAGGKKIATDFPKDHKAHNMFLELYENVNIDPSFYWFTIEAASADDIHYMTKEEIEKYLGNKLN